MNARNPDESDPLVCDSCSVPLSQRNVEPAAIPDLPGDSDRRVVVACPSCASEMRRDPDTILLELEYALVA